MGQISFIIPKKWENETRFEILTLEGRKITHGFINRSGSPLRGLSDVPLSDESLIRYWFFLRKIQRYKVTNYRRLFKAVPNVILRPDLWADGSNKSEWSPVAYRISRISPDNVFKLCQRRLDEAHEALIEYQDEDNKALYVRQFLNAVDLYLEGAFYSSLLSNQSRFLMDSFNKLLPLFDSLFGIYSKIVVRKGGDYKPHGPHTEEWIKSIIKLALPVSILFNFWLYLELRNGFPALKRVDVKINTRRAYALFNIVKAIGYDRTSESAEDRVWDSRIVHLQNKNGIKKPKDPAELNNLLDLCYERINDF